MRRSPTSCRTGAPSVPNARTASAGTPTDEPHVPPAQGYAVAAGRDGIPRAARPGSAPRRPLGQDDADARADDPDVDEGLRGEEVRDLRLARDRQQWCGDSETETPDDAEDGEDPGGHVAAARATATASRAADTPTSGVVKVESARWVSTIGVAPPASSASCSPPASRCGTNSGVATAQATMVPVSHGRTRAGKVSWRRSRTRP